MASAAIRRFASLVKAPGFITGAPKSVTAATKTILRTANAGRTTVINRAAGTALTLPAAKGTGDIYRFVVGTLLTSATIVVSTAPGTDNFAGGVIINDIGDTSPATADFFPTAATSNTFTMTQSLGAGKIGDWIEIQDIGLAVWSIKGILQGVTDPATPFTHV